ncbi:MSMEG_4193 family putative phosphomutase [Ornithinimicrobium avium]|uniref:MSMEG_4193 family putative phosphomutase n=1 Tax=Ornithinimicrobium avium TaxID=2283195 RepID=A0A345NJJ0_9MICO|nr:MSMEG_4193 family putative phosphomutase [Ornithinimicrobium avium]AXH95198.1 MSMEG_4193 family putative phosphomutase [Ornithinimicrobium avium]
MAICLLLRHGRTSANADGVLAGWTPGTALDETGIEQARRVGSRLRSTGVVAVVSSPLQRCLQTAAEVLAALAGTDGAPPAQEVEQDLGEARYGAWTGRPLKELAKEPLWRQVQDAPSAVVFPAHPDHEHEGMAQMQARAVAAVRDWDRRVEERHGPGAVWVAVSHGDVIKAVLADALATPLDEFQRIVVDPASVSIVHRTERRPFVLRTNDTGSEPVDLSALVARLVSEDGGSGDADVGGGAGGAGTVAGQP